MTQLFSWLDGVTHMSRKIIERKNLGLLRSARKPFIIALAAVCFLMAAVSGQAAEQKTSVPQKTPAPQAPAAIPVAEVAKRGTEVSNLLRSLNTLLAPSPHIEMIEKQKSWKNCRHWQIDVSW
jgi:hypothetical protein